MVRIDNLRASVIQYVVYFWWGSGQAVPECGTLTCALTELKAVKERRESFLPPPYLPKRIEKGSCTRKRAIIRDNFLYQKYLSACMANICLPNICSSHLPVNGLPSGQSPKPLAPSSYLKMTYRPRLSLSLLSFHTNEDKFHYSC